MRKIIILLHFSIFSVSLFSQKLSHVIFSGGANFSSFSFITDQKIIIRISLDGKVLQWGNEVELKRSNYRPGDLQEYMGRVEYYNQLADSAFRAKVKNVGTCTITYYGSNENTAKVGKIKSVGTLKFDYYVDVVDKAFRGKLKSMGYDVVTYYSDFENESIKGKLKSVGNIPVSYYTSFDDKLIRGKIKSIGSFNYTWYTSFDRRELQGSLRSGMWTQQINGVMYIIM